MRHKEVNKLIRHGLDQDKIPSTLEPIGLSRRGDKKRKDGLTYPTCKNEKWLIWDFTSADSLSKSYVKKSFYISGLCSSWKRRQKVEKYSNLSDNYHFVPWNLWHLQSLRYQASQEDRQ